MKFSTVVFLSLLTIFCLLNLNCCFQSYYSTQPTPSKPDYQKITSLTERLRRSIVSIIHRPTGRIAGSGVIIEIKREKNTLLILTAAHVASHLKGKTPFCLGKVLYSTLLRSVPISWCSSDYHILYANKDMDLAILTVVIDPAIFFLPYTSPLAAGIGPAVHPGVSVWLASNNAGIQNVVTTRRITQVVLTKESRNCYMLDGSIDPGASGGGVFNNQGRVIGILIGYLNRPPFGIPLGTGALAAHTSDIQKFLKYIRSTNAYL